MMDLGIKPAQPKFLKFADGKYKGKTLEEVYAIDYPWLVATANQSHDVVKKLILDGINQLTDEKEAARGGKNQNAAM
jgi:hypothetical protein